MLLSTDRSNIFVCIYIFCIQLSQWHAADEYDGEVREITFRSVCKSPMCPPDTAMTEWQHAVLSPDKNSLVSSALYKMPIFFLLCSLSVFLGTIQYFTLFAINFSIEVAIDVDFNWSCYLELTLP